MNVYNLKGRAFYGELRNPLAARGEGSSDGLFVEFCSGSRQDFRKAKGIETLDEFRYEPRRKHFFLAVHLIHEAEI